jgi:hypothetical protein
VQRILSGARVQEEEIALHVVERESCDRGWLVVEEQETSSFTLIIGIWKNPKMQGLIDNQILAILGRNFLYPYPLVDDDWSTQKTLRQ